MSFILPFLIALLLCSFFLHDRAYLQGVTEEMTATAQNLSCYEDRESYLTRLQSKRLSHTRMWTRNAALSFSVDESLAQARVQGTFPVPGFVAGLLNLQAAPIVSSSRRTYKDPASLIWKCKAAAYIFDETLGDAGL